MPRGSSASLRSGGSHTRPHVACGRRLCLGSWARGTGAVSSRAEEGPCSNLWGHKGGSFEIQGRANGYLRGRQELKGLSVGGGGKLGETLLEGDRQGLESKVDMDVWLGIQRWGIQRGDPEAGTGSGESLGGHW